MTKYNPVSTYRLQFYKEFTLKDAEKIIPYLQQLGIKTIYASPVFTAVKGSTHGYDVTNPLQLNPEIGSESDWQSFTKKLRDLNMGLIVDIVPNHMAYSPENPWMYDVLEKGEDSAYYSFFDTLADHRDQTLRKRLMLPFFGKPLKQLLQDKELKIGIGKKGFTLDYFDNQYPVSVSAYPVILQAATQKIVPEAVSACLIAIEQKQNIAETKDNLISDYFLTKDTEEYVDECLSVVNTNSEKMEELVNKLHYQPAFWKDTEQRINYRRFFTINGLICMNVQDENVFSTTHQLIQEWLDNKVVQGVRVDHIDGLYNPTEYLNRLRKMVGKDAVVYVEKILEKDEDIPENWPIEGTTGYDFLGVVNNLLTNPEKGAAFNSYYNDWIDKTDDFSDVAYRKSRFILYNRLRGELENLTRELATIKTFSALNFESEKVRTTIGEFLIFCPVYKIYNAPSSFTGPEKQLISAVLTAVKQKNSALENVANALEDLFLLRLPDSEKERQTIDVFFRHCMQFTGPLMAKGIEDTAFYSYNPFICHNEVGDSPGYFGIQTQEFHQFMKQRLDKFPLTMNAISTHDTKRGEDARARLNVLSDMPDTWIGVTQKWREINRKFKQFDGDKEIPTPNDEYLIYQVLCAHLPMNAKISDDFINRLEEYLVKAMREAKVNSSWSNPDEYYENMTVAFVRNILSRDSQFPEIYLAFIEEVIPHGISNSITQLILKNTSPGVPDTFQGTEQWNLSFVDPDNRKLVDYYKLSEDLELIIQKYQAGATELAEELWQQATNGKIKQWITWLTLSERRNNEHLFLKGDYVPLKVSGKYSKHIISFLRKYKNDYLLVILPMNTAGLPEDFLWEDTQVELPESAPLKWINRLTNELVLTDGRVNIESLYRNVPFGILAGNTSGFAA